MDNKKIKVVCMGDSITEGFGLGDDERVYYPSVLQGLLGESYEVFNKGVSGSCATNTTLSDGRIVGYLYQGQPRYDEVVQANDNIVLLSVYDAFMSYKEKPLEVLYQEDGLHPNAEGARLIATTIYNGLKENM